MCGCSLVLVIVAYFFGVTVSLALPSVLFESCTEHISYTIWHRNLKFYLKIHIGVVECCMLFKVAVTLMPGISSWKILSPTHPHLHYLSMQSQILCVDASWCWSLQRLFFGHCDPDFDVLYNNRVWSISPILYDLELPNLLCGYIYTFVAVRQLLFPGHCGIDLWLQF